MRAAVLAPGLVVGGGVFGGGVSGGGDWAGAARVPHACGK